MLNKYKHTIQINPNWYSNKWVKAAGHLAIWVIVIFYPFIFYGNEPGKDPFRGLNAVANTFRAGIFYLNAYLLAPALIYKREIVMYILSLIILFCLMMFVHGFFWGVFLPGEPFHFLRASGPNIAPFLITIAVSITYRVVEDRRKADLLAKAARNENLTSELSFLRTQISPHFIFNILNNIVALVRMKSEELEPTVMRLSALMEYMLYETGDKKVPLKREVEYLQDYIALQQQRFGDFIKMNISLQIPPEDFQIEPLLFIAFVENAFKHGVGLIAEPGINIRLRTEGNMLYFTVQNKYVKKSDEIKDKVSGIGLSNVARRLVLLYPGKHKLVINKDDYYFNVFLEINLA